MTTLPSLSERLDRLSDRERRVLLAGAAASALILIGALVAAPFLAHWRDREASIAVKAEQLARLEAVVASQETLEESAAELRAALARRDQSLVDGSTIALAGSSLQSLVRSYGERSRVSILSLQPATTVSGSGGEGETEGSDLAPVALSLTARGDIYGLVDLLYYLQHGEKLLVVDELRVSGAGPGAGSSGRTPGLLSWTLRLRGFFEPAESS